MIRRIFFSVLFSLAVVSFTFSQTPTPTPEPPAEPAPANTPAPLSEPANPSSPATRPTPAANDTDPDAADPNAPYVRPNANTRFKRYVNGMFGPMALGKTVLKAGWSTWRNSPEEWGDTWEGFGRRVASGLGSSVIKRTTIYGLDESLKLDSHYYRSKKKDWKSKVTNALISPVTARTKEGKRTIGIPRIAGTYTSAIISRETWYPARYDWKDGLKSGTTSLAWSAAFNLVKEFIWKK